MLEYLNLKIGGFFCGTKETQISVTDGIVHVDVKNLFDPAAQKSYSLSKAASVEWLNALEALHINLWRSNFTPPGPILDGEQWKMDYKVLGKRCRHFHGDNAYPENWSAFLSVIDSL